MLQTDTKEWLDVVTNNEIEKRINEGKFHRGPCVVTQFIGRKKKTRKVSENLDENDNTNVTKDMQDEKNKEEKKKEKEKKEEEKKDGKKKR